MTRRRTLGRLVLWTLVTTLMMAGVAPAWGGETEIVRIELGSSYELGGGSFLGDNYSFSHELAAFIDGAFRCFKVHQAGMVSNTVSFDGSLEPLDLYVNGTQPQVFEFESVLRVPGEPGSDIGGNILDLFFNSSTVSGGDLFPSGFVDPETGTPLTDACLQIGIDDPLESGAPKEVVSASIGASNEQGDVIPPTDISELFDQPWDGTLTAVFPGATGQGIDGVVLEIEVQDVPAAIFADGFESGDTSAWN